MKRVSTTSIALAPTDTGAVGKLGRGVRKLRSVLPGRRRRCGCPRRIHVVTPAAAHDGAGAEGSICCGPFLPWDGIWKRCQMFTANCEWRASDVVGRPPRGSSSRT
jgi:hypothetical protein